MFGTALSLTSSYHYQIWGSLENMQFGSHKKKYTHVFLGGGLNPVQANPKSGLHVLCTILGEHPMCVCVCECGLHECMHPEYACRQPSQLCTSASCCSKSPCISNAVFCPSSLLASAGARKVVIFFKVCIDTHL